MSDHTLVFDSSLTLEEIEENFADVKTYSQIMKALHEDLEYERISKNGKKRNRRDL